MAENLTLVFTDIVDSTELNHRVGDARMAALWAAHDRLARQLVRRCNGREVGRSDGFLLAFVEVADAAAFATAYHRELAGLEPPLLARVGMHHGPAMLRPNSAADIAQGATPFEIDGVALPIAARVMSVAQGGQTLLSAAARAALGDTALQLASRGHWLLKGIAEPVELFELGAPSAPPPDSPKAYRVVRREGAWLATRELPHSLPAERDAFIGRAEELQRLAGAFDAGARLVTLQGMGGIGKTRLAQRYARMWLGDHPGGAWFCDLSAATGLDGIVSATAHGLQVPLGRADPIEQLGAAIAGRGQCLVVLDNFEQVAAHAEPTVGAWLALAPKARLLVTSRELLGIAGEQVLVVAPMAPADAVTMFRHRVRATGHSGVYADADERALPELIELLDRLPLAIELAAARARVLAPRAVLERMGDRLSLLASRAGRHDRQATLRATLDWSWGLLSAAEQATLAQLSVFERGFALQAAESVVDLSALRLPPAVVNVVQSLVEKSLLQDRRALRFEMLRTVQDYAAERLRSAAGGPFDATGAMRRHAEYFAGLHRRADAALLCDEVDNLVAAVRNARAALLAQQAVGALRGAWAAIKLRGPFRLAIELADEARHAGTASDSRLRAAVELVAAWGFKSTGRSEASEQRLRDSLAAARNADDRHGEGAALALLGELLTNLGRSAEARAALGEALAAARESGSLVLECEVYGALGGLCEQLGAADDARVRYEQQLLCARRAGDRRWEGGSLGNLGIALSNLGRNAEAEACYRESLAIAEELGDRQWQGNALCNLGLLHHVQGRYADAGSELEKALRIARELGHVRLECVVLCNLGMAVEAGGNSAAAREHFEAALRVARLLADRRNEGQILGYLGLLEARQGRFDVAAAALADGEVLLSAIGDKLGLALLLSARAEAACRGGLADEAAAALRRARSLASEIGAERTSELGEALARVGDLLERGGAAAGSG